MIKTSKFKVGDRVKILSDDRSVITQGVKSAIGEIGVVDEVTEDIIYEVKDLPQECYVEGSFTWYYCENQLELVDSNKKWDTRFINIAKEVSTWSKDPRTKVGAVVVKDKRIISTGYNGLPCSLSDIPERLQDRETKLRLTVHAEMNALMQVGGVQGTTIYVYGLPPCNNCIKHILSSGVVRVVWASVDSDTHSPEWFEGLPEIHSLMSEAGVVMEEFKIDKE